MSTVPTGHPDPERTKILQLYGLLGAAIITLCLPYTAMQMAGLILLVVAMIMIGTTRKKAVTGGLAENHALYLWRTIWIGGVFGFLSFAAGVGYIILCLMDPEVSACIQAIGLQANILLAAYAEGQVITEEGVWAIFAGKPCVGLLFTGVAIMFLPPIFYMVYRVGYGLYRGIGGYRIAKPKAWL